MALTVVVCTAYFALHDLFEFVLAGSVLPVRETNSAFQLSLIIATIAVFVGLLLLQLTLKSSRSPLRETIYVHLYNGLYIDVYITRMLQRIWPAPLTKANANGG